MKKLLFVLMVLAITVSSCGSRTNEKTDTHTHDDGSQHTNHNESTDEAPKQELIEIHDSVQSEKDTLINKHESDHEHSHETGKEHKH